MNQLEGKVAIVTGGAGGFGEGIVRAYVAEGARVVFADLEHVKGERLARELGAAAPPDLAERARVVVADRFRQAFPGKAVDAGAPAS